MAGFRYHDIGAVDLTMIPHPSVTILLDLTEHGVAYTSPGGPVAGSAVIGLVPAPTNDQRGGRRSFADPPVPHRRRSGLLRDTEMIGGTVTSLPQLWAAAPPS